MWSTMALLKIVCLIFVTSPVLSNQNYGYFKSPQSYDTVYPANSPYFYQANQLPSEFTYHQMPRSSSFKEPSSTQFSSFQQNNPFSRSSYSEQPYESYQSKPKETREIQSHDHIQYVGGYQRPYNARSFSDESRIQDQVFTSTNVLNQRHSTEAKRNFDPYDSKTTSYDIPYTIFPSTNAHQSVDNSRNYDTSEYKEIINEVHKYNQPGIHSESDDRKKHNAPPRIPLQFVNSGNKTGQHRYTKIPQLHSTTGLQPPKMSELHDKTGYQGNVNIGHQNSANFPQHHVETNHQGNLQFGHQNPPTLPHHIEAGHQGSINFAHQNPPNVIHHTEVGHQNPQHHLMNGHQGNTNFVHPKPSKVPQHHSETGHTNVNFGHQIPSKHPHHVGHFGNADFGHQKPLDFSHGEGLRILDGKLLKLVEDVLLKDEQKSKSWKTDGRRVLGYKFEAPIPSILLKEFNI